MLTEATTPGASALQPGAAPSPGATPQAAPPEVMQALSRIEQLKGDKEFYAKLNSNDAAIKAAAHQEWSGLHKTAFPAPAAVDPASYGEHVAARSEKSWNEYIAGLKRDIPGLTEQAEREVRAGVCTQRQHDWAMNTINSIIADKARGAKLLAKDAETVELWARANAIRACRIDPNLKESA
jgi:hypothetical protein